MDQFGITSGSPPISMFLSHTDNIISSSLTMRSVMLPPCHGSYFWGVSVHRAILSVANVDLTWDL